MLDWTAAALDRVDREVFFGWFDEGEAVQYFYEPFLQAFDPALRKQLGVWYTPFEVVRYMVARVDMALRDDLGIAGGLAAENVYVLDPCCGTGAYVSEVLRRVADNLQDSGLGALAGARVKQAATERVFGFEIMPAPFVVAHLQVGLTMQALDAPLSEDEAERAGIFLTNALTGWEPTVQKPLPFPELEEERDRAERVKQVTPVLVILGNPPYNGFAGVAIDEEWDLLEAYRRAKRVALPDTRALHDLYIRFFRMAERRITEKTGQGIVCFISNYSWLDGRSFAGMRERILQEFDSIRVDSLNGDKFKTGKVAPNGSPDPSIFSTPADPVGIQVGTAITTLVRRSNHTPANTVGFRDLWGQAKREELTQTAQVKPDQLYDDVSPILELGLPFSPIKISHDWHEWPALTELFPVQFSGVNTNRDGFVIDIDLASLKLRMADYFSHNLSDAEVGRRYPVAMQSRARYSPRSVRSTLLTRGGPTESGFIRYAYRPFDTRWLYWEADTKLLNEKRPDYRPHVFDANLWLSAVPHLRKDVTEPQACVTQQMACLHLIERGAKTCPLHGSARKGWESKEMEYSVVPTCRLLLSTILNASARMSRTCSTTFLRCCTIRRTGRPTQGISGWSGLASRCRAGRTAMNTQRLTSWLRRRHVVGISPRCSIQTHRCRVSRRGRCVLRLRSSQCRPPRTGATWTATTSTSRRVGVTSSRANR